MRNSKNLTKSRKFSSFKAIFKLLVRLAEPPPSIFVIERPGGFLLCWNFEGCSRNRLWKHLSKRLI